MSRVIDTDAISEKLRTRVLRVVSREVLIARMTDSDQEADLTKPPNCHGYGRIRHFRRTSGGDGWPLNPIPIEPALRALNLDQGTDLLYSQVFQNAACNWRCWYCYVPFRMLTGNESTGAWFSADRLIDLFLEEPEELRPLVIDLSGGQPDLAPEWVLWMMESLRKRGLERKVYLWSDDNLSTDYFWRYLSSAQHELIANFQGYGRVACFKGFDQESFAFNTKAAPELFDRQFRLFQRLVDTGIDLYAYVTLVGPASAGIREKIRAFMDRLQAISEWLPLRAVPLRIYSFGVVERRLKGALRTISGVAERAILDVQLRAAEAWRQELEARFDSEALSKSIVDIAIRT